MVNQDQGNLTSAVFICDTGLRVFGKTSGRQETTIVFTTGKVYQRFYLNEVPKKAAVSFEYQLTAEAIRQLKALFFQLDCFHWQDNHRGNRRSEGWEIRLRGQQDFFLRGLFQPPQEVHQVAKRLNELIDFSYPLMLCAPREVKRDQSVAMSRQLEPFLQPKEDPEGELAQKTTNQLLALILTTETGQRLSKNDTINGIEVAGTFLYELLRQESRINRWRWAHGAAFGEGFLCELLLREELYLEDATDLITLTTMMALAQQQLITKDGLREVLAGIIAGYQTHCIEDDHPPRKRQSTPDQVIDLRGRKRQRELLGKSQRDD